tara:strand:- start:1559 stop:2089 length:531 start_codon:yes stop_codon:yes gene_type:complete
MFLRLFFACYFLLGVAHAQEVPEYDRSAYGGWIDADRDGADTRREVLLAESHGAFIPTWECPYTGYVFFDPSSMDIDHLVPLREAHFSGAWRWPKEKKKSYANFLDDSDHLIAVKASANRSKGAKDPAAWLPTENRCKYAIAWVRVKYRWGLEIASDETSALLQAISECPEQFPGG